MTKVFIHPYDIKSKSSAKLAEELKVKRIRTDGKSKYRPRKNHLILNWGSSKFHFDIPEDYSCRVLNSPDNVALCSNKRDFFTSCSKRGLSSLLVPSTTSPDEANSWLEEGAIVVGREKLTGHSGEGIVFFEPEEDEEVNSSLKLYTKYVKKSREYRIHVFMGEVIRVQRKILDPKLSERIKDKEDDLTSENINWRVRNYDSGFIYVTEGTTLEECPKPIISAAHSVVMGLGLDFGAVDIIWNNHKQKPFVLEVNTAPGLEGGTLAAYVEAVERVKGQKITVRVKSLEHISIYSISKRSYEKIKGGYSSEFNLHSLFIQLTEERDTGGDMLHWCNWTRAVNSNLGVSLGLNRLTFEKFHSNTLDLNEIEKIQLRSFVRAFAKAAYNYNPDFKRIVDSCGRYDF